MNLEKDFLEQVFRCGFICYTAANELIQRRMKGFPRLLRRCGHGSFLFFPSFWKG
jgi:hypothetical protein